MQCRLAEICDVCGVRLTELYGKPPAAVAEQLLNFNTHGTANLAKMIASRAVIYE